MTRTCKECGRETNGSGKAGHPRFAKGMCVPCYKRLIWYPQNGPAVERNRETSRLAKRRRRALIPSTPGGKTPGNQSDPATVGAARGHGNQEDRS